MRLPRAACLALIGLFALAGPPQAQGLADLLPEGAYGAALGEALTAGEFDFAALRASYAADPGFTGRSRLKDREAEALIGAATGSPAPDWTEDDVTRAIFADFPLLDTHMAAYEHYKASPAPSAEKLLKSHALFYRDILDVILATRREGPEGPVFTVLSVGEEYAVLAELGRTGTGQALIKLDGVPHDRLETADGPVFFDISAFFGR